MFSSCRTGWPPRGPRSGRSGRRGRRPGRRRRSLPRPAAASPRARASSGIGRAITNRPPCRLGWSRDSVTRPITSAILIGIPPSGHRASPGAPARPPGGRSRRSAASRRSTSRAARPRASSTPSAGPPGPPRRDRRPLAARTPATWQARQTATDASSVTTSAPRCGASATHRAASSERRVRARSSAHGRRAAPAGTPPPGPTRRLDREPPLALCAGSGPASLRATSRSAIPRRFSKSRASGVTTVPAATPDLARSGRQAPRHAAARSSRPANTVLAGPVRRAAGRLDPRRPGRLAPAPTARRHRRREGSGCQSWRSSVGQPHHAPAARRRPAEQLLQRLAVVRHQHHVAPPRPQPVEGQHRLAVGPAIGRLRAARPASAPPGTSDA